VSAFVFIYHGQAPKGSPEQLQQLTQKWAAWMKELAEKGHIIDQGHPLERAGKMVKGSKKTVTDGPFAESKDAIGGYSLIEAKDLAQAVELSKGCPILLGEGAVEVRPVRTL
jgi:hypothetical protein